MRAMEMRIKAASTTRISMASLILPAAPPIMVESTANKGSGKSGISAPPYDGLHGLQLS